MPKKVFISYCHAQKEWVRERLVPCLEAGGAEVIIDYKYFQGGINLVGQMDKWQDQSDLSLLVFSPEYLKSQNCLHEMRRALDSDPHFTNKKMIPVIRENCTFPAAFSQSLYVDLQNDQDADKWKLILDRCEAYLGTPAPDWLAARDEIIRYLVRQESVNLVISDQPKWQALLEHIQTKLEKDHSIHIGMVDLERGAATTLKGLISEIFIACGGTPANMNPDDELVEFDRFFWNQPRPKYLILKHFDMIIHEKYYDVKFFAALRPLVMTKEKKLVLLIQSRNHFNNFLPLNHPLSPLPIKNVELGGRS